MGDKGGQCVGLTTLPPSLNADCLEISGHHPPGALKCLSRPVIGLFRLDRKTVPHFILFNWSTRVRFLGVYANELHDLVERG